MFLSKQSLPYFTPIPLKFLERFKVETDQQLQSYTS